MNSGPSRGRRCLGALGLGACLILLSGCVYLRLLALKRQLGDFDKNFALQTGQGLRFRCLDPVLLTGDFRWLGVFPETITKQGRAELWRVHWVKEVNLEKNEPEPAGHDLELEINFSENKFTGFFIAERYFAFIPKSFLVGLLRGLGGANIDRDKRSVSADIALATAEADQARPTVKSLIALLGQPTERRAQGTSTLLHYRYLPPTPGTHNGDFDLHFTFDTATEALLRLEGKSPVGQLSLNFAAASPPAALSR